MSTTHHTETAVPGTDIWFESDGPSFRRILVPVRSAADAVESLSVAASLCRSGSVAVRLLHVRAYDGPTIRCPQRFYAESVAEAEAILDETTLTAWMCGVCSAKAALVDAGRGEVAAVIAGYASAWNADMIVLTRVPRRAVSRLLLGSVSDQVMRLSNCPVLAVPPVRN